VDATGDLGNVIEVTQIRGRRADRLMAKKIIIEQFWTFATVSALSGLAKMVCKLSALRGEADMRDRVTSSSSVAIDPEPT